jgi:DNA (cytosine-5)-methyltransferase 1
MKKHERIVDLFSGGGGASTGIELALGRSPNVAINHDAEAVCMHEANHPRTVHLCGDVWEYNPRDVVDGPVGLLWASPDCKHFSKAKGGALARSKKIRSLAWVVVRYAKAVKPRVIVLENVEEFQTWGPLDDAGKPDPDKKGTTFRRFVAELRACGYEVEWRELRACDYGAPTTRKRLFLIARCDGQPIIWPAKTHGPGLEPYKTAADCIDWSIPVPSIFGRTKPLAENTLRRIARGIHKFVLGSGKPFVVPLTHHGDARVHDIGEPLPTITAAHRGELALVAPTLIQTGYGERVGQAPRSLDLHAPLGTVVAGGAKHALVCAFLAKHYGGNETPGSPMTKPFDTVTCTDHHALVEVRVGTERRPEVRAFLTKYYGTSTGQAVDAPLDTICAGAAHFGLVTVEGVDYEIADIGMRMLAPRELFRAQGFADSYIIDPLFNGKPLTKTAQTRMCGNSVSPPMAEAIIRANLAEADAVAA